MPLVHELREWERDAVLDALWLHGQQGIALVNSDYTFRRVNNEFQRIVGYTEAELIGKTFGTITHPADVDADEEMADGVADGVSKSYEMNKRYITKLGKVIWVKLLVVPIQRPDGTFEYFVSQISPVTAIGEYGFNSELKGPSAFTRPWFRRHGERMLAWSAAIGSGLGAFYLLITGG